MANLKDRLKRIKDQKREARNEKIEKENELSNLRFGEERKEKNIIFKNGKITEVKPIHIDMSKLDKIKEEHEETVNKLVIEEPLKENNAPVHNIIDNSIIEISNNDGFIESLTKDENDLLLLLIEARQAPSNCELLIESINNKAICSVINDKIIDYIDGVPYIHEEYIDILRSSIGEN